MEKVSRPIFPEKKHRNEKIEIRKMSRSLEPEKNRGKSWGEKQKESFRKETGKGVVWRPIKRKKNRGTV